MQLEKLVTFKGRKGPLLLIVADGFGLTQGGPSNAISQANTPIIDQLLNSKHVAKLHAHGTHVGLPTDSDMGNSEVGHNTLGGGRIFSQGATLVGEGFESGSIFESEAWKTVESRGHSGKSVHFVGLLSDGNVHSHIKHLFEMLNQCQGQEIYSVRVHVLLDGRDVDPRSAITYLSQLESKLEEINSHHGFDYRIASGGGRMVVTMDRYEADWEMVKCGFDLMVHGVGKRATSAVAEVKFQYAQDPDMSDQYLTPFVIADAAGQPVGAIKNGDAVVLFNFRGDRAIEISRALGEVHLDEIDRGVMPEIFFCGMLQYDGDLNVPAHYLVNPPTIEHTMGDFMCAARMRTFAISETQKFGHVTYFWNGNRSGYIDETLETHIEIPSDNIPFDQAPTMKAKEITDATIDLLNTGEYTFGRINLANGDMVGHTGNTEAAILAIESVDQCVGRLIDVVTELQGIVIFTADHGNAEEMFTVKNGEQIKKTSHTLNPVPFVIVDGHEDNAYKLVKNNPEDISGGLANVASTVFNLLGYRAPESYYPSLIDIESEPRSRRLIHQGSVVNLGLETVKAPNGEILALEIVRHPGGAVVVAMDDDSNVCLIKQFRHAANGWIWEFPAGLSENYEPIESVAKRELKEETGCRAEHWQPLGSMLSTPGFCTERLHMFLATGISKGKAKQEPYEFIEIHWLPLSQVIEMATNGEIDDAKTIVALFRAMHL
ncbi:MAG: 2,3-bisphosphoglycerate-independent phosphoglycerate mutase [Gammaproteobacteria bacterium]|nr:2,3-bisphosphoglycerate-independent phosphoglycerate mutase [Gammaproteobacteria bacterium]